jgi:hypothetical protein
MTQNHPIPRLAAVIPNGAYRQYTGHQAALAWAAQADPQRSLVAPNGFGRLCPEADLAGAREQRQGRVVS